ncbi:endonuclease/exonuclease/phosphatase family protein [Patescibacteria group bacterium]
MKLSILQWNIWYKENINNIVLQVKKLNPDILCLQELMQDFGKGIDTAKFIAEKTGYFCFFKLAESWDNRDDKETQGNAIFSKYPFLEKSRVYIQKLKHNPPDATHEGRVYLEADIKVGKKILTVATTHLSYSHKFKITKIRKKEINNLLNILKNKSKNYIFTADLNAVYDSYPVLEISKLLKHAGPDFSQNTWTTKPFDSYGFKEDKLNWRLDYIFASKDVKILSTEIKKTKFSDHLPILLEIEV